MKNSLIIVLITLVMNISLAEENGEKSFICATGLTNNVRETPDSKGELLQEIPRYTPLKKLGEQDDWVNVEGINFTGWIHKSLVNAEIKCLILKVSESVPCMGKEEILARQLNFHEGFKILDTEIGCNYVQDKWGTKGWINSAKVWPTSVSEKIIIR